MLGAVRSLVDPQRRSWCLPGASEVAEIPQDEAEAGEGWATQGWLGRCGLVDPQPPPLVLPGVPETAYIPGRGRGCRALPATVGWSGPWAAS